MKKRKGRGKWEVGSGEPYPLFSESKNAIKWSEMVMESNKFYDMTSISDLRFRI